MRPPDLEALGVMRALRSLGLGAICPPVSPFRQSWVSVVFQLLFVMIVAT